MSVCTSVALAVIKPLGGSDDKWRDDTLLQGPTMSGLLTNSCHGHWKNFATTLTKVAVRKRGKVQIITYTSGADVTVL